MGGLEGFANGREVLWEFKYRSCQPGRNIGSEQRRGVGPKRATGVFYRITEGKRSMGVYFCYI